MTYLFHIVILSSYASGRGVTVISGGHVGKSLCDTCPCKVLWLMTRGIPGANGFCLSGHFLYHFTTHISLMTKDNDHYKYILSLLQYKKFKLDSDTDS